MHAEPSRRGSLYCSAQPLLHPQRCRVIKDLELQHQTSLKLPAMKPLDDLDASDGHRLNRQTAG